MDAPPTRRHWRDFRLLWSGDLVSQIGNQVTLTVLPAVAVLTLHASPGRLGLLQTVYTLPYLLVPVLAGVWLDRRTRWPVLIVTNVVLGLLVSSIPVMVWLGHLTIAQLFLVAALGGIGTVVLDIAKLSYVPGLIDPALLATANSRLNASAAVGITTGPGLGGLLAGWLGPPSALFIDGFSYGVAALTLAGVRYREPAVERPARRDPRGEIVTGFRAVIAVPPIRNIAIHAAAFNASLQIAGIALIVYFLNDQRYGTTAYGIVLVSGGIGGVLGTLVAPGMTARIGYGRTLLCAAALAGLAFGGFAFAPGSRGPATAWFGAALLVASAAMAVAGVSAVTIRQTLTPPAVQARMNAVYRLLSFGPVPIGAAVGGVLAGHLGGHGAMALAPWLLLASATPLALRPVQSLGTDLRPPATVDESAGTDEPASTATVSS